MDRAEAVSENPILDSDSHSLDSEHAFGQFSEAIFASRKRRLFRHMKTQTSIKSSNKKLQFAPEQADQGLQATVSFTSASSQSLAVSYQTVGTDCHSVLLLDRAAQATCETELCDREVEAIIASFSEGAQTEEKKSDTAAVQCGSFFFYMRSVGSQMHRQAESKATQMDIRKVTVSAQSEVKTWADRGMQTAANNTVETACECRVRMVDEGTDAEKSFEEMKSNVKRIRTEMKSLRDMLRRLKSICDEEQEMMKSEIDTKCAALQGMISYEQANSHDVIRHSEQLRILHESFNRQLEQISIEKEEFESHNCELSMKVELLQSEQADYYLVIRELESDLLAEIEDKAEAKTALFHAEEKLAALEHELFTRRMKEMEFSAKSAIECESDQLAIELKLAQSEIELLTLKRIISEKESKIKESNEFIDSLHFQVQNATRDTERVRQDSQATSAFYQTEVARLQGQLHIARFELKRFQDGNRNLCEELESMKEALSEYSMKASLLAQSKSKADISLKGALSDAKHAEEEITFLRKTVARLQKQVRDYEELVQKNKVMMHLAADPNDEETFDTEMQIQKLESEKLELQTDIVDLRRECETVKDRLYSNSESLKKLQEALELQKVKNVTLENILSMTKSSLAESREQRHAAEKKSAALSEELSTSTSQLWQSEKKLEDALASLKAQQVQIQALSLSFDVQRDQNVALASLHDELQEKHSAEIRGRTEAEAILKQTQSVAETKEKRWIAEKEELVTLNEHLSGRIDALLKEVATVKEDNGELQESLDRTQRAWDEAEKSRKEVETEMRDAKEKIGVMEENGSEMEGKHRRLLSEFNLMQNCLSSLTQEYRIFKENTANFEAENSRIIAENTLLTEKVSEIETKLAEDSEKQTMENLLLEQRKLTFYNEKEKLEGELRSHQSEIESLSHRLSESCESISTLQCSNDTLNKALTEANHQRMSAEQQANSNSDTIAALLSDKESLEARVAVLTRDSEDMSDQIEELTLANRSLAEQLNSALASLRDKSDLSVEEGRSLKQQLNTLKSECLSLSERLQTSEQSEERLNIKKEELTERLIWYQSEYEKSSALKKANLLLTEKNIALTEELRNMSEFLEGQRGNEDK